MPAETAGLLPNKSKYPLDEKTAVHDTPETMKIKHLDKLLLLTAITGLLAGCGQEGPLYTPGTKSAYGPPEYSPLHPAKYYDEDANKKEPAPKTAAQEKTQNNDTKTQ
jgi:predicted small lipoprotein YifL